MRTTRAIKSFSSGIAFMLVTLILSVTTTPILLNLLGDERIGAYRTLMDWASNVLILELILSTSLLGVFSKSASESPESLASSFSAAVVGYRFVAIGSVVLAIFVGVQITTLIPVHVDLRSELRSAWLILSLSGVFVLLGPIRPLLEAIQRGYRISLLLILQSITITGVSILCAWLGLGIAGQAIGTLVGTVVLASGLLLALGLYGNGMSRRLLFPGAKSLDLRNLLNLQWPSLAMRLSGQLGMVSDNILIGIMLGPVAVVPFALTQRIPQVAQSILQMVGSSSWAGFAELYFSGQKALLSKRLTEVTRLLSVLGVTFLAPVMVFNERFIELWIGASRYGGNSLTAVAVANIYCLAFGSFWGYLFVGTGKLKEVAGVSIVFGIVNIAVSVMATWNFGIVGPLIGSLTSQLCVCTVWYLTLLRKHFGVSCRKLLMAIVLPVVPAVPIAGLAFQLTRLHEPGWLLMSLEAAILCGVILTTQWFLFISPEDRIGMKMRLSNLLTRKT